MFSGLPPKADLPPDLRTTPAASFWRTPPSQPRASARASPGVMHRGIAQVQREHFDPPDLSRGNDVSKCGAE